MTMTTLSAGWKPIGDAQLTLNSDQQIVINCGESQVQLTPLADDMVRVRVVRGTSKNDLGSWAVVKDKWNLPKHGFKEDAIPSPTNTTLASPRLCKIDGTASSSRSGPFCVVILPTNSTIGSSGPIP